MRRIVFILLALAGFSLGTAFISAERVRAEAIAINDALQQQAEPSKPQKLAQATTASAGPRASDSDAATIRSAAELVRAKKGAAALAKLEPLAGRLAGNPDFDYVYGAAALDAGHPAQAATALRRAIAARPGFHLARAELGRALAAMGDLSGAKREFEAVRDAKGVPALARDAMGRQVTALDQALTQPGPANGQAVPVKAAAPEQPRTRISGYIEHSVGYDTNVNGGPAGSSLIIPALAFLGPATLAPGALPKKAGFYELAGGLNFVHVIDNDLAFFANMVANWHPLFDHNEFRTAQAGGETGFARRVGDLGTFSIAAIGQTFTIGDSVFRNIYGLAGQWRQRFVDAWDVGLALSWLGLDYPGNNVQNADRYTVTGTIARRFEQAALTPAVSVAVNVGKEIARTDSSPSGACVGDCLSFTLMGVRAGLETTWAPWLVAFVQAGYENHRYGADYPLFFFHRRDELYEVMGGLEFKINKQVSLRPSVRYSETRSNVDLFDQKRWISQAALRWTF